MHTYIYRNKVYTILPCTEEDISEHYDIVAKYHPQSYASSHPPYMREAIKSSTAIKLIDGECKAVAAMYYCTVSNGIQPFVFFHTKPKALIVFAKHIAEHILKDRDIITFLPAKDYPSYHIFADDNSIIGFYNFRKPLVIRKDSHKAKRILQLYRCKDGQK
jgi:hypothetical protein